MHQVKKFYIFIWIFICGGSIYSQIFPRLPKFKETPNTLLKASGGYGVNFGYNSPGINMEFSFNYFAFHGGFGIYIGKSTTTLAYQIGLHGYILPIEKPIRPRVGIQYGTGGIFNELGSTYIARALNISLGMYHIFYPPVFYEMEFHVYVPSTFSYKPQEQRIKTTLFSIGIGVILTKSI